MNELQGTKGGEGGITLLKQCRALQTGSVRFVWGGWQRHHARTCLQHLSQSLCLHTASCVRADMCVYVHVGKEKKSYVGSEALPTSIKEKESPRA